MQCVVVQEAVLRCYPILCEMQQDIDTGVADPAALASAELLAKLIAAAEGTMAERAAEARTKVLGLILRHCHGRQMSCEGSPCSSGNQLSFTVDIAWAVQGKAAPVRSADTAHGSADPAHKLVLSSHVH